MSILTRSIVARADWLQAAATHRARVSTWTQPTRERRARGEQHPVHDFLHTYYRLSLGKLERWHPGFGITLEDCAEARCLFPTRHYRFDNGSCTTDPALLAPKARQRLEFTLRLLRNTQARPSTFACHGLPEWAMVYRGTNVRHRATVPLRMPQEEIDLLVESRPLCCTHFDAFRFFAPEAQPLNRLQPNLWNREDNEQPGCIHTNMDLYKWAAKSMPWVASDLLWDCFELAIQAREVDMRASPYDLSSLGYQPIRVETGKGREEYEHAQRLLCERAAPLRQRLIDQLGHVLAAC